MIGGKAKNFTADSWISLLPQHFASQWVTDFGAQPELLLLSLHTCHAGCEASPCLLFFLDVCMMPVQHDFLSMLICMSTTP